MSLKTGVNLEGGLADCRIFQTNCNSAVMLHVKRCAKSFRIFINVMGPPKQLGNGTLAQCRINLTYDTFQKKQEFLSVR